MNANKKALNGQRLFEQVESDAPRRECETTSFQHPPASVDIVDNIAAEASYSMHAATSARQILRFFWSLLLVSLLPGDLAIFSAEGTCNPLRYSGFSALLIGTIHGVIYLAARRLHMSFEHFRIPS